MIFISEVRLEMRTVYIFTNKFSLQTLIFLRNTLFSSLEVSYIIMVILHADDFFSLPDISRFGRVLKLVRSKVSIEERENESKIVIKTLNIKCPCKSLFDTLTT